jgi:hypothetical protein
MQRIIANTHILKSYSVGWAIHIPFQFGTLYKLYPIIETHFPYPPTPYIVNSTSPIFNVPSLLFLFILSFPILHTPSPSFIFLEVFSVVRLLTAKN